MIYILTAIHNRKELTLACLNSLYRQTYTDFHIVVVDDGSTDGSEETIKTLYPKITIIKGNGKWWWAKSLNEGLKDILPSSKPDDFILFINNDTEVEENYLEKLVETSKQNDRALVGSILKDFRTKKIIPRSIHVDWSNFSFPEIIPNFNTEKTTVTEFLTTRGTLVPIEVFKKIGLFTSLLPHHGADINFSMKARRAGFQLILSHEAIIYDKEHPNEKTWSFWYKYFGRRSSSNISTSIILVLINAPTFYLKIKCLIIIFWRFFKALFTYLFKN